MHQLDAFALSSADAVACFSWNSEAQLAEMQSSAVHVQKRAEKPWSSAASTACSSAAVAATPRSHSRSAAHRDRSRPSAMTGRG
eukprot:239946-Amphidinium_carterae.1